MNWISCAQRIQTIRFELDVMGDTRGLGTALRLQQLLGNLVSNAIKYGESDAPVRDGGDRRGDGVRIEVEIAGPALDPTVLEQIFDPLKRGPVQRHETYNGLGLGLYIVREVARAHGGDVDVRSDEGKTVFTVRLPRRNEANRPEQDQRIPSNSRENAWDKAPS